VRTPLPHLQLAFENAVEPVRLHNFGISLSAKILRKIVHKSRGTETLALIMRDAFVLRIIQSHRFNCIMIWGYKVHSHVVTYFTLV
jgi:hypothetical protein